MRSQRLVARLILVAIALAGLDGSAAAAPAGRSPGAPAPAARAPVAPAPVAPRPAVAPGRVAVPGVGAAASEIAGRQRVAVVRLDFEGSVAEAARELFASRVVEGLAAAQFEVFSGAGVAQRLAASGGRLANCRDDGCYPALAQALAVSYLVAARVAESNKNYEISLELINGRTGGVIGSNRERCEICGVDEAGEKMALAASALRTRLEALTRTPARFIIRSRPAGVAIAIDGAPAGRTPIDRELTGGPHKLELAAAGYDRLYRTVTAVSGVDETIDLDLVPIPMKFPFGKAGWAALIVGAASLAAGIWAVSVDGNPIACEVGARDDLGHCPTVRNTRSLGAALIGVGAATATLGGAWLYIAGGGPAGVLGPTERASAGSVRGASLLLGGRF